MTKLEEFIESVGENCKRPTGELSFGEFGEALLRAVVKEVRERAMPEPDDYYLMGLALATLIKDFELE